MGLIDRIRRLFRANLNSFMSSAEDPEKILEAVVMEMQDNLQQLRQMVAQAIATQKRTQRQLLQAESTTVEWYHRAQLALQQGNEPLARDALTKRRAYQETKTALSTQIEQQNIVVDRLKKDMRTLEAKIAEAKNKKDMYIARARSAEAAYRLQEMLSPTSTKSSQQAFEQMEEKVVRLEAQSEAIALTETDDLLHQFAPLQSSNDVDAELATMKQELESKDIISQQLPKSQDK